MEGEKKGSGAAATKQDQAGSTTPAAAAAAGASAPSPAAAPAAASAATTTTTSSSRKRPAPPSGSAAAAATGRPSPKLFVGNLHRSVRDKDILQLFMPLGRVVKADMAWHMAGPRKGEPRGFAFVEYATTAEAQRAVQALDGTDLRGRRLLVRFARDNEAGAAGSGTGGVMHAKAARARVDASSSSSAGRGGGGGRGAGAAPARYKEVGRARAGGDEEVEEHTLEAKILMLKAKLAGKI